VCWLYPKIEDGYVLPLNEPGPGIEARCIQRAYVPSVNEGSAASKPFMPSLQPQLNGLDGSAQDL
jgi:hypothetical protein